MTENLKLFSTEIRLSTCKMLLHRGFGHLGGSMSIIETLSVLFGEVMNVRPKEPGWKGRDYFVLSKGHAAPAYYSTLALKGYFPIEMLDTLNDNGTNLPSHPDRLKVPGVDTTTGSLGQGISMAVGIAKSFKISKIDNRVFCIVGDGECNEGQVWEAFQFAAHNKLNNLTIFIDENLKQLDGFTTDILNPFDLKEKATAFGLFAIRVDGADEDEILKAINECKKMDTTGCIILNTVKGQGIKYFEEMMSNHHVKLVGESNEEMTKAIAELESKIELMKGKSI
jgi:transketolase